MFSSSMSRSSILIPLLVLVILIAVLALVLYYDIKHTYRDGDLWKKWQYDMPSSMTLALSVMTIYWVRSANPCKSWKLLTWLIKSATFFLSSTFYLNSFDVLILLAPIWLAVPYTIVVAESGIYNSIFSRIGFPITFSLQIHRYAIYVENGICLVVGPLATSMETCSNLMTTTQCHAFRTALLTKIIPQFGIRNSA